MRNVKLFFKKMKESSQILQERVSTPCFNYAEFKAVMLYLIVKCRFKKNITKVSLCNILYFIDFDYYELYETQLTGASYFKCAKGPLPIQFNRFYKKILSEFMQNQSVKPKISVKEKEVIDSVLNKLSLKNERFISDYAKNDLPYKASDINCLVGYELTFYRNSPYSIRNYGDYF